MDHNRDTLQASDVEKSNNLNDGHDLERSSNILLAKDLQLPDNTKTYTEGFFLRVKYPIYSDFDYQTNSYD